MIASSGIGLLALFSLLSFLLGEDRRGRPTPPISSTPTTRPSTSAAGPADAAHGGYPTALGHRPGPFRFR